MTGVAPNAFKPRKTPVQARSVLTVDAIMTATIQVLVRDGVGRLTTTRVAERAGVSVGTLYQYFPNKRSLLLALLERKLDETSAAIETACRESHGKPLAAMMRHVVERFVDAKMSRPDVSTALHRISGDVGGPELVRRVEQRARTALATMLATSSDVRVKSDRFAVTLILASMSGATRSVLETGPTPEIVQDLREHLALLCESYAQALAISR